MALTDRVVARARYDPAGPQKLTDGRGLYLFLTPAGGKIWRYDFRLHGQRRTIALGTYDDLSLAAAREKLREARALVAAGQDPVEARRESRRRARSADTLATVADEWIGKQPMSPATRKKKRLFLRLYVLPSLGARPVATMSPVHVLELLRPIEARGRLDTAHRVKQLIGQILRYAIATGRATDDATAHLRGALAPVTVRNHAAPTTPRAVGAVLRALDSYQGSPIVAAMLRLAPLVFVRPGELRRAEWSELDLAGAVWRIPAGKMKMRADHLVPLSRQAVAILEALVPVTGGRRYVFASPRHRDRPVSDMTLNAALRALGLPPTVITPHGFRAMARTLLDEQLRCPPDVIEVQLAHVVRGPLGATYNRSQYLEARTAMMQTYADFLDSLRTTPA